MGTHHVSAGAKPQNRKPENRNRKRGASRFRVRHRINPKSADKPGSVTALARYGRHSSRPIVAGGLEPPTRGLGEQPDYYFASAYLVLLRMEVAAFHPPACNGKRLVSVALFLAFIHRANGDL